MSRYKSKLDGKVVTVINDKASGMCSKTLGITMVVYKYEDDTQYYPFIMEHQEFYQKHYKLINKDNEL